MRRLWSWSSRQGSLGPGLTRWECHLHRAHVLDICPWEVASLFGALVVSKEPAEALWVLHTAFLVVLHRQQRGLADCQKVPGLQIQVLFLVLGKCIEGKVLKTFRCHFVREAEIKMATDDADRVPLRQQGSAIQKSSSETTKALESLKSGVGVVAQGVRGDEGRRGSHPKLRSIFKSRQGCVLLLLCLRRQRFQT